MQKDKRGKVAQRCGEMAVSPRLTKTVAPSGGRKGKKPSLRSLQPFDGRVITRPVKGQRPAHSLAPSRFNLSSCQSLQSVNE